jgi:choline dehydrogenase-like flavoprotein
MGRPDDPTTVVDEGLGVLGAPGLFVADASVIPRIPRAGTNLAAMMIGQRGGFIVGPG